MSTENDCATTSNKAERIVLDVRRVGYVNLMKGDKRSAENFAFPASAASMFEAVGEDADWRTVTENGREWTERFLNRAIVASTGIGFALLWDSCPSCLDLTLVNTNHNDNVRHAFDYAGYAYEIIEKTDDNKDAMRDKIVASLKAGKPVIAFGVAGPPEAGIICGYDPATDAMLGWSHSQNWDWVKAKIKTAENKMFIQPDWHKANWKIVICGEKTKPNRELKPIIERGVAIMESPKRGGYLSGAAAYDAWIAHVENADCDTMPDDKLKSHHWFHDALLGSHSEARWHLSKFLADKADGDANLLDAAKSMMDIHDACQKLRAVLGGHGAKDAWKEMRNPEKRAALAALVTEMKRLDADALKSLKQYCDE